MKYCIALILGGLLCFSHALEAQQPRRQVSLSMEQAIRIAQGETPDKVLAETRLLNRYWQYQAFRGTFKPQLGISATLPDFTRSINPITQPDGDVLFLEQSFMTSDINLGINQVIPGTGTSLRASTGISRLDNFSENAAEEVTYRSNVINLGINQPLFQFNQFKWDRKIQPLLYDEATKTFNEELEQLAFETVNQYFDLYNAQLNLEAALLDKKNTDSLLFISQGRFEVGTIAETDLLQIELTSKNAESSIARSQLQVKTATEQLRNLLGIRDAVDFQLVAPPAVPEIELDRDLALGQARANRSQTINFRRQLLEAEREVDRAYKSNGVNVDLGVSFGLSQRAENFPDAYMNLLDQERISLGLEVPITDWGATKAQRQIALTNQELTQLNVEQAEADFEREILNQLDQYELVKLSYELADQTFEVAQKKFEITQARYFIGKIGTLDLNTALSEKESARRQYIQSLKDYWLAYYTIRNLTLYDFVENRPIRYNSPIDNLE
jgi:outer membrane protein TolC